MNDIRMIVADMDGTFLNSKYEVTNFPEIYQELKKRNIVLFQQVEDRCRNYKIFWRYST